MVRAVVKLKCWYLLLAIDIMDDVEFPLHHLLKAIVGICIVSYQNLFLHTKSILLADPRFWKDLAHGWDIHPSGADTGVTNLLSLSYSKGEINSLLELTMDSLSDFWTSARIRNKSRLPFSPAGQEQHMIRETKNRDTIRWDWKEYPKPGMTAARVAFGYIIHRTTR